MHQTGSADKLRRCGSRAGLSCWRFSYWLPHVVCTSHSVLQFTMTLTPENEWPLQAEPWLTKCSAHALYIRRKPQRCRHSRSQHPFWTTIPRARPLAQYLKHTETLCATLKKMPSSAASRSSDRAGERPQGCPKPKDDGVRQNNGGKLVHTLTIEQSYATLILRRLCWTFKDVIMFHERLCYWAGGIPRSDVGRWSGRRPEGWTTKDWHTR
jgi:hypothetical protein